MDSASEHSEKRPHPTGTNVNVHDVDVAAVISAGSDAPLDPQVALQLKYVNE